MHVPVLIAGGGPVGLTLALVLARFGVSAMLVERNVATTQHPKMDITNVRSMEIFRSLRLAARLRAVAVPENHCFDVSWVTTLAGHELHRFRYPSVVQKRAEIAANNDGTQPLEPPMRVSQVVIEPVLKRAVQEEPLIISRFGTALEECSQSEHRVSVILRDEETSAAERITCDYLAGCDGATSRVRACLGIGLQGHSRLMQRYSVHFRSHARETLQRWGPAWHYQSALGTLIAQDDFENWTLHTRPNAHAGSAMNPHALLMQFLGQEIPCEIVLANPWTSHLLVAERYGDRRIVLAGDAAHQYAPTGGYGMNTGIGDAFDLGWKLAALVGGIGGAKLLSSYDAERRPVGLRNREASGRHTEVRLAIAQAYAEAGSCLDEASADGVAARSALAARIAAIGNAENESLGIELGYAYTRSPIVSSEPSARVPDDPVHYVPTTAPGARLPSITLADGSALFDRLGPWFTLLAICVEPDQALVNSAGRLGVPLKVVHLEEPALRSVYDSPQLLVRADQHIAWRGRVAGAQADAILARCLGRA